MTDQLAGVWEAEWAADLERAEEAARSSGQRDVQPVRKFRSALMPEPTCKRGRRSTPAERFRARWGPKAVGDLPLDQLPSELLEIVARHALGNGSNFALVSRATMSLSKRLLGIDSIAGLAVQASLTRIGRTSHPHTQLLQRLRFVTRAVRAGHKAHLFVFPKEKVGGPYPSPLREIDYGGAIYSLRPDMEVLPDFVYPMENNMHVTIANPDPMGDACRVHAIEEIRLWGSHRAPLPAEVVQGNELRCAVVHCEDGYHFTMAATNWRDHPEWTPQSEYSLRANEARAYCSYAHTCCRRMAVQLALR